MDIQNIMIQTYDSRANSDTNFTNVKQFYKC